MTSLLPIALLLAFIWGIVWALFLQFNRYGRWLAIRRTWASVVIGVGGDLALLLLVLDVHTWVVVVSVVAASSLGVIGRSFLNEHHEDAA